MFSAINNGDNNPAVLHVWHFSAIIFKRINVCKIKLFLNTSPLIPSPLERFLLIHVPYQKLIAERTVSLLARFRLQKQHTLVLIKNPFPFLRLGLMLKLY